MSKGTVYGDGPAQDGLRLKGRWTLTLTGPDGEVKDIRKTDNIVCTNGKEFLASFLYSAAVAASTFTCRYVAIGSSDTTESATDTALGGELARVSGVVSYVSGRIYQVTATFPAGTGTGQVREYGVFSTSSVGTMLNRNVEDLISKGASDTLTAVCQLTIG